MASPTLMPIYTDPFVLSSSRTPNPHILAPSSPSPPIQKRLLARLLPATMSSTSSMAMATGGPLNSLPFPVPRTRKRPSLPCLRLPGPGRKLSSSSIASAASMASTSSSHSRSRKHSVSKRDISLPSPITPITPLSGWNPHGDEALFGAGFGFEHPRPAPKPRMGSESDDSGYAEALHSAHGVSPRSLAPLSARAQADAYAHEAAEDEAVPVTEDEGETDDAEDTEDTPRPLASPPSPAPVDSTKRRSRPFPPPQTRSRQAAAPPIATMGTAATGQKGQTSQKSHPARVRVRQSLVISTKLAPANPRPRAPLQSPPASSCTPRPHTQPARASAARPAPPHPAPTLAPGTYSLTPTPTSLTPTPTPAHSYAQPQREQMRIYIPNHPYASASALSLAPSFYSGGARTPLGDIRFPMPPLSPPSPPAPRPPHSPRSPMSPGSPLSLAPPLSLASSAPLSPASPCWPVSPAGQAQGGFECRDSRFAEGCVVEAERWGDSRSEVALVEREEERQVLVGKGKEKTKGKGRFARMWTRALRLSIPSPSPVRVASPATCVTPPATPAEEAKKTRMSFMDMSAAPAPSFGFGVKSLRRRSKASTGLLSPVMTPRVSISPPATLPPSPTPPTPASLAVPPSILTSGADSGLSRASCVSFTFSDAPRGSADPGSPHTPVSASFDFPVFPVPPPAVSRSSLASLSVPSSSYPPSPAPSSRHADYPHPYAFEHLPPAPASSPAPDVDSESDSDSDAPVPASSRSRMDSTTLPREDAAPAHAEEAKHEEDADWTLALDLALSTGMLMRARRPRGLAAPSKRGRGCVDAVLEHGPEAGAMDLVLVLDLRSR